MTAAGSEIIYAKPTSAGYGWIQGSATDAGLTFVNKLDLSIVATSVATRIVVVDVLADPNDDFSNQAVNPGQPLYFNSEELTDVNSENVAGKYEDLQKIRNQEIQDFLSFQQQNTNTGNNNNNNNTIENFTGITNNNYLNERSNIDQMNAVRDPLNFTLLM
jgi:hypothetical protein